MKKLYILLFAVAALYSCKGKPNALPKKPFVLEPFEITNSRGPLTFKMDKNGNVSIVLNADSFHISTIDTSGVMRSKDNKVLAYLKNDSLFSASKKYFGKIDSAGAILSEEKTASYWDPAGKLIKAKEDSEFRISPVNTKAKQAASMIIASYMEFLNIDEALKAAQKR